MSLVLIIAIVFGMSLLALIFILAVARLRGDPEEENRPKGRPEENRRP